MIFKDSDANVSENDINLFNLTTGFGQQFKFMSMTRMQKQNLALGPIKRANSKQNNEGKLIRQPWKHETTQER